MNKMTGRIISTYFKLKKIAGFSPHDTSTQEGKSNERYRRILLTGGTTAVVKLFSVAINLITVPLTVNYLGAERYGLWMSISSIMALMGFADLGLGNGLLNAVSKANGRSDEKEAQVAVSSTFFILFGIASLLFIIFMCIYPFISWGHFFNVKSAVAINEAGPTMLALVSFLLINMPLGIIERVQAGYQEGYRFQVWLILGSLFSLGGLLVCIFFKSGLTWLVIAFAGGQLAATILNGIYLFSKKRKYLRPAWTHFNLTVGKKLVASGSIFFLLGMFTLMANSSDNIIIAHVLGAPAVAGYEIVKKIFLFSMFIQYLIQPLWPAFAEAMASGDILWAKKTLTKCLVLAVVGAAVLSLPLLLFGKQIIAAWVNESYVPSWSLLGGFYIFVIMANYGGVMSTFLNSGPLLSKQLLMIGLAGTSAVLFKIYFSMHIGVSGIIWATVAGYAIFFIVPSYKLAFRYLNNISPNLQKKENP